MKPLIAYSSASGEAKKLAKTLADVVNGDLFEIRPKVPYTAADLDWRDKTSRSTIEMNDPACRPAIADAVPDIDQYDTIYIGSPIGGMKRPGSSRPSWRATT